MDKNRSQHYNFTFESIPIIFHSQTDHFFKYLDRDGIKFLEFWWDHMGVRLDDEHTSKFEGMEFEIRPVDEKKSRVVLIVLPAPKNAEEAYFIALVETPKKRFPVHLSNTRAFVLQSVSSTVSPTGTVYGEITPRGRYLPMGNGPQPDLNQFYEHVLASVWKKKA